MLAKSLDALSVRNSQRMGQVQSEACILQLEKAIQQAENQLEAEEAETRTLRHMKTARRGWNTQFLRPLQAQKSQLSHILAILSQETLSLYHLELEAKQAALQTESLARAVQEQRERNRAALDLKTAQYRHKREFEELLLRQTQQKTIAKAILANQSQLQAVNQSLSVSIEAEKALQTCKAAESQGKSQETLFRKLSQAASSSHISDIVDYWSYLQTTQHSLESCINDQSHKIAVFRKELDTAKAELAGFRWQSNPMERLSPTSVEKYQLRLNVSQESLSLRVKQVLTTQLTAWELYTAQVAEGLQRILHTFLPGHKALSLPATCEEIVQAVQSCLSRADGR